MIEKIDASPVRKLYDTSSFKMLKDEAPGSTSFADFLKDALKNLNDLQVEADSAAKSFLSGEVSDIHKTMIVLEKANLNLRLAMQIRNKIIQAYEEITRMQI